MCACMCVCVCVPSCVCPVLCVSRPVHAIYLSLPYHLLGLSRRQEQLKRPKPTFDKPMNEGLERFKFWLGLPNHYYQDDWQSRGK